MEHDNIEFRVIKVIRRLAGTRDEPYKGDIRLDTRLGHFPEAKAGDYVDLESVQSIELVCLVEEEFELALDEDEALGIRTVGGIVDLVEHALTEQYPSSPELRED